MFDVGASGGVKVLPNVWFQFENGRVVEAGTVSADSQDWEGDSGKWPVH